MILAVDTGFVLQLAEAENTAWALYSAIRASVQPWALIATPAVVGALDQLVKHGDDDLRFTARSAWERLSDHWGIKAVVLDEAQRKVAWILTYQFMERKIVLANHRWEAELLGEASLLADVLLVAETSPLAHTDVCGLTFESRRLGMRGLCLSTPATLLKLAIA
jgi:hypothetical protein